MQTFKTIIFIGSFCLLGILDGCALSTKDARDPLENWNRDVQSFNDKLDDYALKPVAKGYQYIMPKFADIAVTNFFSNINDIGVAANDVLQCKFAQGGLDSARFLVNTVAGLGGFVDVAQTINLPKHNEDFDQTLGFWGVPTGPYLVLPLLGPSSIRGVSGTVGDTALNPVSYSALLPGSFFSNGYLSYSLTALRIIDQRADNLGNSKIASEAAVDRYEFFKSAYLQRRNYLVNDGKVPEDNIDLDENDLDFAPTKKTMPSPTK